MRAVPPVCWAAGSMDTIYGTAGKAGVGAEPRQHLWPCVTSLLQVGSIPRHALPLCPVCPQLPLGLPRSDSFPCHSIFISHPHRPWSLLCTSASLSCLSLLLYASASVCLPRCPHCPPGPLPPSVLSTPCLLAPFPSSLLKRRGAQMAGRSRRSACMVGPLPTSQQSSPAQPNSHSLPPPSSCQDWDKLTEENWATPGARIPCL